jgi:hypothetical protein
MSDSQIPSSRRVVAALLLVVALAVAAAGGWRLYQAGQPTTVNLEFLAVVGDQPLLLNQLQYANPGGEGTFKIRAFQFYLSNLRLLGNRGEYVEPASYHLLRFDNETRSFKLVLEGVPRDTYSRILFSLGVDPAANASIAAIGDLDANGRMAWNWEVGYKFLLFEGGLQSGEVLRPLVYHIGFDENYRPLAFDLDQSPLVSLQFRVDIMQLFAGTPPIDMERLSNIKFDRGDAGRMAENFDGIISLCAPSGSDCP